MSSTPYYHTNGWSSEQHLIVNKLTPSSGAKVKANDGLGNIISQVGCYTYKINMNHPHVATALEFLSSYPFPKDFKEFHENFRFREWEYVAEALLLAVRLKRLVANEFQRFILGLYIFEYHPICCCECGLTPGYWCGECFIFIIALLLTYL
jgi:hypothetical protein